MKRKLVLLLIVLLTSLMSYSQVGINTETPNVLTEFDVHNLLNGTDTIPKGIMIPRMSEAKRNLINVSNMTTANSLMIYNTTEDCYNYFSKSSKKWISLCGAFGKSDFTFDCSTVVVMGTYVQGKDLTTSNALKFLVTVNKAGSYSITGTTTNGYYFETSGVFAAGGTYTVYAQGKGTPAAVQTDNVTLSKNGEAVNCAAPVKVTVVTPTATYSLNCATLMVLGQYAKGTALTGANKITVSVTVSNAGSYNITTPVTNGISFSASGTFMVGTQNVILLPDANNTNNKPTVNTDFPITVYADTPSGNNTCTGIIPITLPGMTYAIIGTGIYSWASPERLAALSGPSFGTNGIVKITGLTQLWSTPNVSTAATNLTNGVGGKQPDIVLYFAYGASPNGAVITALINYINKGGCVIYGTTDNDDANTNLLLNGVFGTGVAVASNISNFNGPGNITDDNAYQIANLPNDPIINGPFGGLMGKYWGEDNSGTVLTTKLPPNSVQVCTANSIPGKATVSPDYSVVWYNNNKNFLYIGDSVSSFASNSGTGSYPSLYLSGVPSSKLYGPGTGLQFVYDSALEMNGVAWALKKAAVSGINPH